MQPNPETFEGHALLSHSRGAAANINAPESSGRERQTPSCSVRRKDEQCRGNAASMRSTRVQERSDQRDARHLGNADSTRSAQAQDTPDQRDTRSRGITDLMRSARARETPTRRTASATVLLIR